MGELTYEKPKSRRKKPGPTARYRAKRRRAEGPVAKRVRKACVDRDGYCRICDQELNPDDTHMELVYPEWSLDGPSEWAHLNDGKRAKTRGMAAQKRHTTTKSLMLCKFHHDHYDGRRLPRIIICERTVLGADGPLDMEMAR